MPKLQVDITLTKSAEVGGAEKPPGWRGLVEPKIANELFAAGAAVDTHLLNRKPKPARIPVAVEEPAKPSAKKKATK